MSQPKTEIRPLTVMVTLLISKDQDGYTAVCNGRPETTFSSEYKEEAIDGSLELTKRLIHKSYG
jgi:hypothetical protein